MKRPVTVEDLTLRTVEHAVLDAASPGDDTLQDLDAVLGRVVAYDKKDARSRQQSEEPSKADFRSGASDDEDEVEAEVKAEVEAEPPFARYDDEPPESQQLTTMANDIMATIRSVSRELDSSPAAKEVRQEEEEGGEEQQQGEQEKEEAAHRARRYTHRPAPTRP